MIPGLGRSPGEEKGYPLQYSGLKNSMVCIVHGVAKSQAQLSDFHFHRSNTIRLYQKFGPPNCFPCQPMQETRDGDQKYPLEKGVATHSSILAWKRPWTKEPGGLQSMGSQRVGPD